MTSSAILESPATASNGNHSAKKSSRLLGLKCKECGTKYEIAPKHVCELCFGPLEVAYDYEVIAAQTSREKIAAGPYSIWRYQDFLPVEGTPQVNLQAGFTPLVRCTNLAKRLGIRDLYIKNDTANPTWSFKDRVVSTALSRAKEFGFTTAACASTGNLANSVAAHAASAGMDCYVFIPSDLEAGKIMNSLVYKPKVVAVEGNYDQVNRLCAEVADRVNRNAEGIHENHWAFVNVNLRPFYSEGSKTLAYEVAEQLGWVAPDHVVIPIASGSMLTKIYKGFNEWMDLGLIERKNVKISGAQAEGCSPVAQAFRENQEFVAPVRPNTIAKSLAIGNPADGIYAKGIAQKTGGTIDSVTDEEVIEGIKLLAECEGIFAETAGGVTIANLKKMVENGSIKSDEVTVAYITGGGLKTQEALTGHVGQPMLIRPNLASFEEAWGRKI
ncbi:threonine synthase [bacterium]|nr:MAG: threonine synthase [bacterium]